MGASVPTLALLLATCIEWCLIPAITSKSIGEAEEHDITAVPKPAILLKLAEGVLTWIC
jgi:hypothetical protein